MEPRAAPMDEKFLLLFSKRSAAFFFRRVAIGAAER
jgi:hypothetical protein